MAVLYQKIIPVAYAYVILSKNSTINNENELFEWFLEREKL